ncbi:MAG: integrase [Bryobacterales bacterium]|nr:integrase [Bryobacterales bacterium]
MNQAKSPIRLTHNHRLLTAAEFQRLADVPPEVDWFRNIDNAHTERAYRHAIADFTRFTGVRRPKEFRQITRAHVIAWRDELVGHQLDRTTNLFQHPLCRPFAANVEIAIIRTPNQAVAPALQLLQPSRIELEERRLR